jgi:RNA polymerase sigma factor (sigma-70 family)
MSELRFSNHEHPNDSESDEIEPADIDKLYRDNYGILHYQLCQRGIPQQEVRDFIQEGFCRTVKSLRENGFAGNQKQLHVYVRTASWRAYLDSRRRDKSVSIVPTSEFTDVAITTEIKYDEIDHFNEVVRLLEQLTPDHAGLMYMLYGMGLPQGEVAERLGIKHGTVKSRSTRIMSDLRRIAGIEKE